MLLNIADHDSGFVLLKCVGTLALNMVIKGMSDIYNTMLMIILRSPNHRFLSIIQAIVCDDGGRNGRCWGRRGESKENDVVGCHFLFYRSRQTMLLFKARTTTLNGIAVHTWMTWRMCRSSFWSPCSTWRQIPPHSGPIVTWSHSLRRAACTLLHMSGSNRPDSGVVTLYPFGLCYLIYNRFHPEGSPFFSARWQWCRWLRSWSHYESLFDSIKSHIMNKFLLTCLVTYSETFDIYMCWQWPRDETEWHCHFYHGTDCSVLSGAQCDTALYFHRQPYCRSWRKHIRGVALSCHNLTSYKTKNMSMG